MNKRKSITFGDKIFARVSRNGQTIYNFVSEKVSNMADLLSQLRRAMKDFQGLVMIHIRNYNQGWGEDRPLMLYARKTFNTYNSASLASNSALEPSNPIVFTTTSSSKSMLFPWDTH